MISVIKRDGTIVPFNAGKIENAVLAAFKDVDEEITDFAKTKAKNIGEFILDFAQRADHVLKVEEIQDLVEKGLMSCKRKDVAKSYILYRDERSRYRGSLTDTTMLDYLEGKNEYWSTENSNKDAAVVTTQRDYIAGIASTDIAKRKLLPRDVCEAHEAGIIHEHDMDYLAQNALTNCCLINLDDMLQNGTRINGILIEKPHRLITATTIATQIITAVASSQYGGSTITLAHLAPFVRSSKEALEKKYLPLRLELASDIVDNLIKNDLHKEVEDAVQTFNYQINSMSTTNG